MSEPKVKQERSGWRDQALSERHRKWGWNCPMVDIDFLNVEYDNGLPVALVEYKHERAAPQYPNHPSYRALRELGNRADLPFFAVRYAADFSWWNVVPLNGHARERLIDRKVMTEHEWVAFLYHLRGREMPDDLFDWTDVEV